MHVCRARPILGAIVIVILITRPAAEAFAQGDRTSSSLIGRDAVARALGIGDESRESRTHAKAPPSRACPGCPERRLLRPYMETIGINILYNGINHLRGHPTAIVGFNSWEENIRHGFEWDDNRWITNQFGHQYQGSNYFTAGRANGLSFWESGAVAAFGSATWEYFAENNRASLNDFINTTVGGIAIGEVLHRTAWLARNPAVSRGRRELIASVIDPMSGLARLRTGDIEKVADKPPHLVPSFAGVRGAAGGYAQWTNVPDLWATTRPYVEVELLYGDARRGRSETPYEAFTAQLAVGGDLVHSAIHGRLWGRPFGRQGGGQVSVFQTYEFITNPAYAFGGQGFEAEVGVTRPISSRSSFWMAATGGATILAAADSPLLPPNGTIMPPPPNGRAYDYGPGARFGGVAQFIRDGQPMLGAQYQGYQVNVVDGTRANHILQRLYLDARIPVSRQLAVGAAAEYFFRTAYFWGAGARSDRSTQFRLFLAWSQR